MPYSSLTTGSAELWRLVLSEMAIDGKTYSSNLSKSQILDQIVTDVGGSDVSYLQSSRNAMLASAANTLVPGTALDARMSRGQLLAALVNALQSTSPGVDSPDNTVGLRFNFASNSMYLPLLEDI